MNHEDVVIVAAARTPQGRLKGQLSSLPSTALGSIAIRGALEKAGISPDAVDAVIVGQVLPAGAGQNPARQASIGAGIGWDVPASAVNKVCLSGLTAVIDAARMIRLGDARVVVAAGMESMSQAPHLLTGSREGWSYGSVEVLDHMAYDGLTDAFDRESMGASTERHNDRYGVSREDQDAVAARSHQRAAAAWEAGIFDDEIVPVEIPQRKGDPVQVTRDEGIRPDTTAQSLAGLRPAFSKEGSITAGNSSQISDGASAVVLTSRSHADENGWPVLAVVASAGQVAGPDNTLHAQPARRSPRPVSARASPRPTLTSSRSTRPSGLSWSAHKPNSDSRTRSSTCTAAASRSVIPSAHPATASSFTPFTNSCAGAAGLPPSRSAAAAARGRRSSCDAEDRRGRGLLLVLAAVQTRRGGGVGRDRLALVDPSNVDDRAHGKGHGDAPADPGQCRPPRERSFAQRAQQR